MAGILITIVCAPSILACSIFFIVAHARKLHGLFMCRLPVAERRNYKNVFNALGRICKEEGVLTMWRVAYIILYYLRVSSLHRSCADVILLVTGDFCCLGRERIFPMLNTRCAFVAGLRTDCRQGNGRQHGTARQLLASQRTCFA